jgi:hypothetical protein
MMQPVMVWVVETGIPSAVAETVYERFSQAAVESSST